jgi:hypothetical protein
MARKTTLVAKVEALMQEAETEATTHYQNAVGLQTQIDDLTAQKRDEEAKSSKAAALGAGLTKLLNG